MKYFTQKNVNELRKQSDINGLIRLWNLEKEKNPVYQSIDEIKKLSICQKDVLFEHLKKNKFLGLTQDFANEIMKQFCI